jgi:hypothetical protein
MAYKRQGSSILTSKTTNYSVSNTVTADILVVGGGGAGCAGGGGGGGVVYSSGVILSKGLVYTITLGAGGVGIVYNASPTGDPVPGGATSISVNSTKMMIAPGGGGGMTGYNFPGHPGAGASGGGFVPINNTAVTYTGGVALPGFGFYGGGADLCVTNTVYTGAGGGGGAGGTGANGRGANASSAGSYGGNGGVGLAYTITGSSVYYGGGGGGGFHTTTTANAGNGGAGGGGGGSNGSATGPVGTGGSNGGVAGNLSGSNNGNGGAGGPNSGGGGGGTGNRTVGAGGNGGSGTVIIRVSNTITPTATTGTITTYTPSGYNVYKFTTSGSITF